MQVGIAPAKSEWSSEGQECAGQWGQEAVHFFSSTQHGCHQQPSEDTRCTVPGMDFAGWAVRGE